MSDWRLRDDGTIAPRFGFAGTRNPGTCMRHQHHVYWRLDFDIEGAGNDIVEQGGLTLLPGLPLWRRLVRKAQAEAHRCSPAKLAGPRQAHTAAATGIIPDRRDGTADAYGVADLWFLRYRVHRDSTTASPVVGGTPADTQMPPRPVPDRRVHRLALTWSSGTPGTSSTTRRHPSPHQGHIVGPELRPINW